MSNVITPSPTLHAVAAPCSRKALIRAWKAAWRLLGPHSRAEEFLAVYQSVYDAETLPQDAGLFLETVPIDAITYQAANSLLSELEPFPSPLLNPCPNGVDDQSLALMSQIHEEMHRRACNAWPAVYALEFHRFGETDLEQLFRGDRKEFECRREAGREYFLHAGDADLQV